MGGYRDILVHVPDIRSARQVKVILNTPFITCAYLEQRLDLTTGHLPDVKTFW